MIRRVFILFTDIFTDSAVLYPLSKCKAFDIAS